MLMEQMLPFNVELLTSIENSETEKDLENMASCDTGICPIF